VSDCIVFNNVSFSYPKSAKNALEDINLSVKEGEFFAVMGENTAGKTTFCRLINGIIPHLSGGRLSGSVIAGGLNTKDVSVPELSHKVGMVLDDPDAQAFTSTVFHEVAFGPENILLPRDEVKERVKFAVSAVGLDGFEDRMPATLSGGEKQRLSIAAALAMKGKIIVLDEPLCRLDPQGAQDVLSVIKKLKDEYHITVVMAAHESEKMAVHADRVCILKNGRIAACDSAEKIFDNNVLLEENGIMPFKKFKNKYRGFADFNTDNEKSNTNNRHDPVIEIKDFSFFYPNGTGIENINLSIAKNDFTAIIGNNGCGKTTLLKNITGLLRPGKGDIYIHGKNNKNLECSDISKEIGFVMQNPDTQLFTDSVFNEVAFALKNMRLPKTEIKKRTEEALEITGLKDADAFPHALNRADRIKTVIACVLAMGSKIIIFDEVDAGNDYNGNLRIMNIAGDLHSRGYTIIFVTHNMFLAEEYAHRLIKLERNGIVSDIRNS